MLYHDRIDVSEVYDRIDLFIKEMHQKSVIFVNIGIS